MIFVIFALPSVVDFEKYRDLFEKITLATRELIVNFKRSIYCAIFGITKEVDRTIVSTNMDNHQYFKNHRHSWKQSLAMITSGFK